MKDHLWHTTDIAKSVLVGGKAVSACGIEKEFTRADIDELEYGKPCAACFERVAKESAPNEVSYVPKVGWLAILERAWAILYEEANRPKLTYRVSTGNTSYYIGKITSWDK